MSVLTQRSATVDKQRRPIREKLKIAGACVGVFCILVLPCIVQARWIRTDRAYQKGLAWMYGVLPVSEYECESFHTLEDGTTRILFWPNRFSLTYTPNRAVRDIAYFREKTMEYLEQHPDSELNDTEIYLLFHLYADVSAQVSECNPGTSASHESPCTLKCLTGLDTELLSSVRDMHDLHSLDVKVKNVDDVAFFADWKDLRYLNIRCRNVTQEQREQLCEVLPDCEIWIVDEKIQ